MPGWRVTTDMLLRIGTHFLACHSFSLVIIPFLVVMPCHSVKRSEESRFSKYCLERLDSGTETLKGRLVSSLYANWLNFLHVECRYGNLENCPGHQEGSRRTFCARKGGKSDFAGVAQLVEHLICNQRVGGSNPFASSRKAVFRKHGAFLRNRRQHRGRITKHALHKDFFRRQ